MPGLQIAINGRVNAELQQDTKVIEVLRAVGLAFVLGVAETHKDQSAYHFQRCNGCGEGKLGITQDSQNRGGKTQSQGGMARQHVRVANLMEHNKKKGKTLFHAGDMLRFLDKLAKEQGSGLIAPEE